MRLRRVVVAAATAALVAAGRGENSVSTGSAATTGTSPALALDEAAERLRQLVDETVAHVFPDASPELLDGNGEHGCGSETEDRIVFYGLSIDVPAQEFDAVIASVRERWEPLGSEDDDPGRRLNYELDGFGVGLSLFPDEDRVTIGGSTVCFPPS